ncbi:MAG: UvrD-helicase domain-containing protein [Actinobacteria bacterium]|nr:UvrD-helicase domain-containing protein [Actinomycetota bacterium]
MQASGKTGGFGHVVVDEAQDLTPMQWRVLARLGRYATWNIVGDPNQATLASPQEMDVSIADLPGGGRRQTFELAINYRTPPEIMRYASEVSGLDLGNLRSIRESGASPRTFDSLPEALGSLKAEPGSTAIIAMTEDDAARATAEAGQASEIPVLTAIDAKGLEFDNVVLYRPERLLPVASRPDASLLLIAATRATRNLAIVEGGAG